MTEWVDWAYTEEKPYPETLDTKVIVKFRDGKASEKIFTVGFWYGCGPAPSNWEPEGTCDDIIAYRLAT